MTSKTVSFVVQTSTGDDATFTVDYEGEFSTSGYDEEYEVAYQAMGGKPSKCSLLVERWQNSTYRMDVLVEYVLVGWRRDDVITLVIDAIRHASGVISDNAGDATIDYQVSSEAYDLMSYLQSVIDGSLPLMYDKVARGKIFQLSNKMFTKGGVASSSLCDALINLMDWLHTVELHGWPGFDDPVLPRHDQSTIRSLSGFFGFLADAVNDAMVESGKHRKHGSLYRDFEKLWQIRAVIDRAAEIESRKP